MLPARRFLPSLSLLAAFEAAARTGSITAAAREILELGQPWRLLVNHWHEAMYAAPDLDIPIFVHEDDVAATALPITGTFSKFSAR